MFFEMFEEAELKLIEINKKRKNSKSITCTSSLEEVLELIKPSDKKIKNKDINVTILLHPACHPKDFSINKLQTIFNKICKETFQDLLKIHEWMITRHNPKKN